MPLLGKVTVRTPLRLLTVLLALVVSFLLLTPTAARAVPPSPAAPATAPVEITKSDVDAWLDGAVLPMLDQAEVPGATVSVVHNGELLTARGYGSADRATRFHDDATPVDPERHLFRIGSISKLFTAVSAMQLVEQGKLNLDADVQEHLDFELDTPKGTVTARDLLTHSGGFEEYMGEDFMVFTPEQMKPLAEAVQDQPAQIYEPGTVTAYSNYGTALLGRLVEIISGQDYADYVDQHILQPLDMTHSSAAQPLPTHLQPDMVSGFTTFEDTEPAPFEHISGAPAGSVSATSVDMAKFANFVLGHEPGVLEPETLQMMQTPALDPGKAGVAATSTETIGLQFWLGQRNGHDVVYHGGDTGVFHSMLVAVPDKDLAIFIASNGNGNGDIDLRSLIASFDDRYLGTPSPVGPAIPSAPEDAAALAGNYTISRQQRSGVLKLVSPLSQMNASADADGTLTLAGMKLRETSPGVWQQFEGRDPMGGAIHAAPGTLVLFPAHSLLKVPWYEHKYLVFGLALFWVIVTVAAAVSGTRGALRRRRASRAGEAEQVSRLTLWARRLTPFAAFAPLSVLMAVLFLQSMTNLTPAPVLAHIAHVLIVIALIAGIAAAVRAVTAARGHEGWRPIVGNGVLTLALLVFAIQCVQFNLLEFGVRF